MATTSTNCVPIASNLFKLFSRKKVTKPPLRFGGHKRKAFKKDGQIVFEENTHKKKVLILGTEKGKCSKTVMGSTKALK